MYVDNVILPLTDLLVSLRKVAHILKLGKSPIIKLMYIKSNLKTYIQKELPFYLESDSISYLDIILCSSLSRIAYLNLLPLLSSLHTRTIMVKMNNILQNDDFTYIISPSSVILPLENSKNKQPRRKG